MPHILIDILFLILTIILFYIVNRKMIKHKKNSENLINILSKNINFLDDYYKKNEISQLNKSINLYSILQILLKVSKFDYVSFFKYDYSKNFIILNLSLNIDNNGGDTYIKNTELDKLSVTSSELLLKVFDCNCNRLCCLTSDNFKNYDISNNLLIKDDIEKIYYKNIFKNNEKYPDGFILLSYKDKNKTLSKGDEDEILRISKKIKYYI